RSPPGLDLDGERIITSDEALTRTIAPRSVTIVGAGAIGVEWASLYRDFGAEVTLVEFLDRIVPLEDPEISKELARLFRKRGITIHAACTIDPETIKRTAEGLTFTIAAREGEKRTEAGSELILVAVGRRPLTEGIGLEQIEGVKVDRGFVIVGDHLRTAATPLYPASTSRASTPPARVATRVTALSTTP